MTIILIWFIGAILIGVIGGNKGRSGFSWFLLALLISPLLALLFVLAAKDRTKAIVTAPPPQLTTPRSTRRASIVGDNKFRFPIVGESHYQEALEEIAGERDEEGARNHPELATLMPEPTNPYDPNAVVVKIEGETVGYLARDTAPLFRQALAIGGFGQATCAAVINGGWDRGDGDQGEFGVRLNACLPFVLRAQEESGRRAAVPISEVVRFDRVRQIVVGLAIGLGIAFFTYYLTQGKNGPASTAGGTTLVPRTDPISTATPTPDVVAPPLPTARPVVKPKPKPDANAPMELIPPSVQ